MGRVVLVLAILAGASGCGDFNNMYCEDSSLVMATGCDVATSVMGGTCSGCDSTMDYTAMTGGMYSCDGGSFYLSGAYAGVVSGCYYEDCEYSYSYSFDPECDQYSSTTCAAGSLMIGKLCGDDDTCSACVMMNYTSVTNGLYSCDASAFYSGGAWAGPLSGCSWNSCDDDDDNDDDDDCDQYKNIYCDDSTVMYSSDCDDSTCSSCASELDYTAFSGGMYTCDGDSFYQDGSYGEALPGCYYEECGSSYSYSFSYEASDDFPWPACVSDCSMCLADGNIECTDDCSANDLALACGQCAQLGMPCTPFSVDVQCIDCGRRLTGRALLFGYINCC